MVVCYSDLKVYIVLVSYVDLNVLSLLVNVY